VARLHGGQGSGGLSEAVLHRAISQLIGGCRKSRHWDACRELVCCLTIVLELRGTCEASAASSAPSTG
jgi:hypothetical protein